MTRDTEIFDIIRRERERQTKGIELIASENFVSDQVLEAMGSVLTNKYAEGYPGKRYYGGCEVVDESENIARDRLKKLFDAEYVNVQPHSGAQANMCVFMACLKAGDKFLGLNLSHGGHLSHGSPVNFSGLMFQALEYNLNEETGRVDYDQLEQVARAERPKLIIAGASAYSREWDYARIRKVADEIGAIFMVDMAHPAGLIAAKRLVEANSSIPALRVPVINFWSCSHAICTAPFACQTYGRESSTSSVVRRLGSPHLDAVPDTLQISSSSLVEMSPSSSRA